MKSFKALFVLFLVAAVIVLGAGFASADMDEKAYELRELCANGTPEEIQAAIDGGADVKAKNADGDTALMMAARYNENPKAVSVLLKAGADVNAQFAEYTPLMYAAGYNKNPKVVSVLIEAGADVNAMGYEGSTVLSVAESNENEEAIPEIVSILKKAGAK